MFLIMLFCIIIFFFCDLFIHYLTFFLSVDLPQNNTFFLYLFYSFAVSIFLSLIRSLKFILTLNLFFLFSEQARADSYFARLRYLGFISSGIQPTALFYGGIEREKESRQREALEPRNDFDGRDCASSTVSMFTSSNKRHRRRRRRRHQHVVISYYVGPLMEEKEAF